MSFSIDKGNPKSKSQFVGMSDGAGRFGRTSSCQGQGVIRRLRCTMSSQNLFVDLSGRVLRTLKNPERVIWPLQSMLSVTFACFRARGSIAGVNETPFGTVLFSISMVERIVDAIGAYIYHSSY